MSNPSSPKDTEGSWRTEGKPGSASKTTWSLFGGSGSHKQFNKAERSGKKTPTLTNISSAYPTTSHGRRSLSRSRSVSHSRHSSPSRIHPPVPPQSQETSHPGLVPGNSQSLIERIGGLLPVETSQISEVPLATPLFSSADAEGIPAGSDFLPLPPHPIDDRSPDDSEMVDAGGNEMFRGSLGPEDDRFELMMSYANERAMLMTSHMEIKELFETVEKDADLMNFFPSAPNSRFSTPTPGTDELVHKKLVHAVVGDATPTPKQVAELAAFKSLQEEMSEKPQPFTILFPEEESVKDKGRVNFEMICDIARSLNSLSEAQQISSRRERYIMAHCAYQSGLILNQRQMIAQMDKEHEERKALIIELGSEVFDLKTKLNAFTKEMAERIQGATLQGFKKAFTALPSTLQGQWKKAAEEAAHSTHPATTGPVIDEIRRVASTVTSLSTRLDEVQKENMKLKAENHKLKTTATYVAQTPAPSRPTTPARAQTPFIHSPIPRTPSPALSYVSNTAKSVAFEQTGSDIEVDYSNSPLVQQPPVPSRPATPRQAPRPGLNPLGLTHGSGYFLKALAKLHNTQGNMASWAQILSWGRFGPYNAAGNHINWQQKMGVEGTKDWLDAVIRRAFQPGSYQILPDIPTGHIGKTKAESKALYGWSKCLHDGYGPVALEGEISFVYPETFSKDLHYSDLYTPSFQPQTEPPGPKLSQNQPTTIVSTRPQRLSENFTAEGPWLTAGPSKKPSTSRAASPSSKGRKENQQTWVLRFPKDRSPQKKDLPHMNPHQIVDALDVLCNSNKALRFIPVAARWTPAGNINVMFQLWWSRFSNNH